MTTVHHPLDVRIFHKECRTLAKNGYVVTLIAQNDSDCLVDGVKIRALPRVNDRRRRMLRLPGLALKLALDEDADVYHFHDPELIPVGLALKKQGKKVIYDIHEDVPRQILSKPYLKKGTVKIASFLFEQFENFAAKQFDFLITATAHIKERFIRLNKNTVDVNNYPLKEEFLTPIEWSKRSSYIIYIGGISRIRGIIELLEAMENVEAYLHLAGEFEDAQLQESVKTMPGWSKVTYHGFLDRDGVRKLLNAGKVGIVTFHPAPNNVDGMPNKLFEYMAAGIPVVASNFPLWRQIIESNGCGICVDPLNPVEIANAINYLLNHDTEAQEMGTKGRYAVENVYNWETEAHKLLAVYQKISDSYEK